MSNAEFLLRAEKITKTYFNGDNRLEILKGVDLSVKKGEAICIKGESGAGKSTLLHILGTLDQPTTGEVYFEEKPLVALSEEELASFRNKNIGFVFQFHHLLSEFSSVENVMMPAWVAGHNANWVKDRAAELLALLGLNERLDHYPSQLSGGEKQRVAIARSLMQRPKILLADEPTGNLDEENAQKIQDVLFSLQQSLGLTLLVVTHNPDFIKKFPKIYEMRQGRWYN